MKQSKKTKLPLSTVTVRSLSRSVSDDQLAQVVGGFVTALCGSGGTNTIILSKCAYTTGATCQQ